MGLNLSQVKEYIVRPTLSRMPARLISDAAVNLLSGTALAESELEYLTQLDGGPALGLWQMEPLTYRDCIVNFLAFDHASDIRAAIASIAPNYVDLNPVNMVYNLCTNAALACAMARVKYFRSPLPLPEASDPAALADYHKAVYNTELGEADAAANVVYFQAAIAA